MERTILWKNLAGIPQAYFPTSGEELYVSRIEPNAHNVQVVPIQGSVDRESFVLRYNLLGSKLGEFYLPLPRKD